MALTDKITNIADAIRTKTKTTEAMTLDEMPSKIESIETKTEPNLQDKSIEITENGTTNIKADEGYDGLNNVEVTTNVASSGNGDMPKKGVVVTKWDENGYPLSIKTINLGDFSDYMFAGTGSSDSNYVFLKKIKEIIVDETTENVGYNTFIHNPYLNKVALPKVVTLNRNGNETTGVLSNNPRLQAVWIGNNITSIDLYSFYQDYAIRRVFINLPRATVKTFSNYSSIGYQTFPANLVIVCNDDAYFKTQEEFEAIDWSTYIDEQTDCSNLFSGTTANKQWVLNQIPYYKPTNGFKMFYQNTNMSGEIDMTPMDVSQCTNFESMFEGWSNADVIDVSNWDTSQATNFQSMFIFCFQTDGAHLDLSSFNTEKVTNMAYMFWYTTNICILDLSSFDFTNVTNAANMFNGCGSKATTNYGAYAAGVPYIYVKDETAQNWVLTANNAHPTTWSTANVVIKSEVTE